MKPISIAFLIHLYVAAGLADTEQNPSPYLNPESSNMANNEMNISPEEEKHAKMKKRQFQEFNRSVLSNVLRELSSQIDVIQMEVESIDSLITALNQRVKKLEHDKSDLGKELRLQKSQIKSYELEKELGPSLIELDVPYLCDGGTFPEVPHEEVCDFAISESKQRIEDYLISLKSIEEENILIDQVLKELHRKKKPLQVVLSEKKDKFEVLKNNYDRYVLENCP